MADKSDPQENLLRSVATGGQVIVFKRGSTGCASVLEQAGRSVAPDFRLTRLSRGERDPGTAEDDGVLVEDLGLAIVGGTTPDDTETAAAIAAAVRGHALVEEVYPEMFAFADEAVGTGGSMLDTIAATWGVQAIGGDVSPFTGQDVKVAVLDTGIDADHVDLAPSIGARRSFVPDQPTHDGHGHGTHCAGIVAGRSNQAGEPRYGVAQDAQLVIGKVLDNAGIGRPRWIVDGVRWAIEQGCDIISLSFSSPAMPGGGFCALYDRLGQLALDHDCLMIAGAGNHSDRHHGYVAPVARPANAPSIMAVAAVDPDLAVADFSCGAAAGGGSAIDLAAPGVRVYSAAPSPRRYSYLPGTSMAGPHVAGVAALWAESAPHLRGRALWNILVSSATDLPGTRTDIGAGLVRAP